MSPSGLLRHNDDPPALPATVDSAPDDAGQIDWGDAAVEEPISDEEIVAAAKPTSYEEATVDEQDDRTLQDNSDEADAAYEPDASYAESDQDDDLIPTDELHSGWLTDDLLAEAGDAVTDSDDEVASDRAQQLEDDTLQALAQDDLFSEIGSAAARTTTSCRRCEWTSKPTIS